MMSGLLETLFLVTSSSVRTMCPTEPYKNMIYEPFVLCDSMPQSFLLLHITYAFDLQESETLLAVILCGLDLRLPQFKLYLVVAKI
jgi:hypothetical protein